MLRLTGDGTTPAIRASGGRAIMLRCIALEKYGYKMRNLNTRRSPVPSPFLKVFFIEQDR